ncbi:MAG: ribosome small subunit-dependent GTPase A [Acidobacteriota bacterium]
MDTSFLDGDRLHAYGYSPFHRGHFEALLGRSGDGAADLEPARVLFTSREQLRVMTGSGDLPAALAGHFHDPGAERPAVGDFVAITGGSTAVVRHLLPRRTCISRKVSGDVTREQVVAANVDTIFLVMGLDGDYNLRRLERFTVLARESGADPVVVLSKADLCDDAFGPRLDAQQAAPGMPVYAVSSLADQGLDALEAHLGPGRTVALLGSSGAGKSTLINRLAGREVMRTGAVRSGDDRGRHTTTHRELVPLPDGGLLLDNPGIRELQLWAGGDALDEAFGDIEELAKGCRFNDCTHRDEPGCAVLAAVSAGELDPRRLENWRGLVREIESLERRKDVAARRRQDKKTGKLYKRMIAAKRSRQRR